MINKTITLATCCIRSILSLLIFASIFFSTILPAHATENDTAPEWIAGIAYQNRSYSYCSASLIHQEYILTAYHCIPIFIEHNNVNPEVFIGSDLATAHWRKVDKIYTIDSDQHPDIAILHLTEPVQLESYGQISRSSRLLDAYTRGSLKNTFYGWSTYASKGTYHFVPGRVVNQHMNYLYPLSLSEAFKTTFNQAGASKAKENFYYTRGDSGGPFINSNNQIFGVLSALSTSEEYLVKTVDNSSTFGIYATFYQYLDWIDTILEGKIPEKTITYTTEEKELEQEKQSFSSFSAIGSS